MHIVWHETAACYTQSIISTCNQDEDQEGTFKAQLDKCVFYLKKKKMMLSILIIASIMIIIALAS